MKLRLSFLCVLFLIAAPFLGGAQEYLRMIDSGNYPVEEVIASAEAYFANRDKGRGTGYKPYKRWEYNAMRLIKEDGYLPNIEERLSELEHWNSHLNETAASRSVLPDSWRDLGPTYWNATSSWSPGVGRITALAFENGNSDHMIIGANTGGVWRSTDGAQTWRHLTDYFSHLSVYSVAIHPSDSNIYYFGSIGGKIFKSMDSGATWSLLGTVGNSMVNKIVINPANPDIIFATAENSGIYRSGDGGETWGNPVADSQGYDIEFKPGDLSVVYASGTGFHKSTDGGLTFTTVDGFTTGPKMIGVSEADPERVYVLEAEQPKFGAFYSSNDAGGSFQKLNHQGRNFFGYSVTGRDDLGQAPRDMAIAVNPDNADEVHIAGILTWRSMDAGVDFTITSDWIPNNAALQNIGYCHADVDDLIFNGSTLFAVTDGGIFKAENTETINADYFEDLTEGLSIRQFYKIGVSQTAEVIVLGGSQDNGTSFYKEATESWRDWLGADGMEAFVEKNNSNNFFGTSQFGTVYRSTNGGASYYNVNTPGGGTGNWVTPLEQDPILSNTLYVGYRQVYKSVNNGSSWTSISQNFGANLDNLKIAPSNSQKMYASYISRLYRTEDGGDTNWSLTALPGGRINSIAIHPTDPNKIAVALTSGKKVVISNDGGETWIDYRKNLPNFSALALVWDDNGKDGLYLGMDYGVYYIDTTFEDWQPYSNLLPNVMINELEINNENRMLYAGTYGRGLWVSPLVEATVGIEEITFQRQVDLYPNPAISEAIISMPYSLTGEVRVFDSSGKLLFYDQDAVLGNSYSLDVSSLSVGTYFVRINTSKGETTKKLIKQ